MLVDIIIPTYSRKEPLKSMIASIIAQTDDDWGIHVVIDNPDETFADSIIQSFDDNRIRKTHMDKRYNDWGHTLREYGKQSSPADYILMTGDDNYYTPNFVHEIREAAKSKPGMIYWDMVHSHYEYSYFKCELHTHQIDMGAFATRSDLAKQIKLKTNFAADGDYVEDYKKTFAFVETQKIDKILFIHN